jgi:hypothetical protein
MVERERGVEKVGTGLCCYRCYALKSCRFVVVRVVTTAQSEGFGLFGSVVKHEIEMQGCDWWTIHTFANLLRDTFLKYHRVK